MMNIYVLPELSNYSKSAEFYGSLEALPGSVSEDKNIVICWQGLIKTKATCFFSIVIIEECGPVFATVSERYQILSSDVD